MKKSSVSILIASSILFTSCLGSFSAFNKLKDWNQEATSSKIGNEAIFIALLIIPVYELALLADAVVFNSIEFWDGQNPIAMQEGEEEKQFVKGKNSIYEITATKNKFHIEIVSGKDLGSYSELIYEEKDQSWTLLKQKGKKIKLTSLKKGIRVAHLPNNKTIELNKDLSKIEVTTFISEKLTDFYFRNQVLAEN